jgi:EAL domain-containing protein (putative c-di-GMP-specific phosphodiesterase class I)
MPGGSHVLSEIEQAGPPTSWFLSGCLGEDSRLVQVPINRIPFQIGRQQGLGLTLASRNVSKVHAELIPGADLVFVRDLGSTNGTWVNGRRIDADTPTGSGDLLQFADVEFRLGCDAAATLCETGHTQTIDCRWGLIAQVDYLIDDAGVTCHYQPIFSLGDGSRLGFEALARSAVPGLETPFEMFTAAGKLNLAEKLSQTCRMRGVTEAALLPQPALLFVNTHPDEQLMSGLLDSLREIRRHGPEVPLVIEIHEAAVTDIGAMHAFRTAIRDLGMGLAYDDFGAGQSRLLDLAQVPPDYLKFDMRLVRDLHVAPAAHQNLVATLVRMVGEFGIAPLAEGIESAAEADVCREIGFAYAQGFHFGRPAPVQKWLASK